MCLLSVLCPKPRVANGKLTSTDQTWYPINTTVTFVCHEGYHHFSGDGEATLKDSWTATCLADGNWTPLPKCVSTVVQLFLDECCLMSAMKSNPDPLKKPFCHCCGGDAAVFSQCTANWGGVQPQSCSVGPHLQQFNHTWLSLLLALLCLTEEGR